MPCFYDHVFDVLGECAWDFGYNGITHGDREGGSVGLGDVEGEEGGLVEV